TGTQQIHISADIAYGIWNYWNHTLDDSFMIEYGAEILFETARFWISRSTWKDGQYHILGVVGPDEYHHSVNDNAFTNWMAHFNVSAALSCHQWLKSKDPEKFAQLVALLSLTPEEAAHWSEYLEKLHLPGPNEAGVIEQFEGFYKLKPSPLSKEDRFRAAYLRLLNWQETSSTQLVKQADVLMLFFLFPDRFSREVMEANYRYYEPLTDHASSLSPPVHATVAAQLGFEKEAETYFLRSLELDLQNLMSNTALGVHPACMGATWQALVTGFLGLRFDTEGFRVAREVPPLPASWKAVEFSLRYRKRIHPIRMSSTLPVARREA
ncbi:MAG TPA: hypothetical protein DCS07_10965, partial [Bdellovibrionales bacterium]|nr:hypothetical protein [Bdellovibrionales bacterium]